VEAIRSSETSLLTRATRRHIPEDEILQLKSLSQICDDYIKAGHVAGMRWEVSVEFPVPVALAARKNCAASTNTCKKKRKAPSQPVID
jgi:hypothetical protein